MSDTAWKRCPGCGESKPHSEFHRNRTKADGLHDYCKPCQRRRVKAAQAKKGKHILNRMYRYGLTDTEVVAFLDVPVCQCCGLPFTESGEQCIDHCHTHGHVRGVICKGCNTACSGSASEAIQRLSDCIEYLKRDLERIGEQG